MSTIHNTAERGEIAKTVLMPGDPLRARFIADNYLEDAALVNEVRCAYCYTGKYKGKSVSVMASGMGNGSMGIYSYELFTEYDVEKIIRVGSAGGLSSELRLGDIVFAMAVSSDANYDGFYSLDGNFSPCADYSLLSRATSYCKDRGLGFTVGSVFSGARFHYDDAFYEKWAKMGILAIEMESAALYTNAAVTGKKALAMFTISDLLRTGEALSPAERQTGFNTMIETALACID